MKYLVIGQNARGERLYKRARARYGWDWTYFRPDAKRFPDRKTAERWLSRYNRVFGSGMRAVVRVDQDADFSAWPSRIILRERSRIRG